MAKIIPIDLRDGQEHGLKFSAEAIDELEVFEGRRSIYALLSAELFGMRWALTFLQFGLRWERTEQKPPRPAYTRKEIAAMVDGYLADGGELPDLLVPMKRALEEAGILKRPDPAVVAEGANGKAGDPLPLAQSPEAH